MPRWSWSPYSITAPFASGWSLARVGLEPTGKSRYFWVQTNCCHTTFRCAIAPYIPLGCAHRKGSKVAMIPSPGVSGLDQQRAPTGVSIRATEKFPPSRLHKAVAQSEDSHPYCRRWRQKSMGRVGSVCRYSPAAAFWNLNSLPISRRMWWPASCPP